VLVARHALLPSETNGSVAFAPIDILYKSACFYSTSVWLGHLSLCCRACKRKRTSKIHFIVPQKMFSVESKMKMEKQQFQRPQARACGAAKVLQEADRPAKGTLRI
jgi:hypothetical protein